MTMHKAWHPRDDVVLRREGRKGLASIEDSVEVSIQQLEEYIEKRGGRLITATRNNINNTRTSGTTITRKQKCKEKPHERRFKRLTSDISHEKTGVWLRKGNLNRETEFILIVSQNNTVRTNHIKARIDKTQQNSRCRLCGDREETINKRMRQISAILGTIGWSRWSTRNCVKS